MSHSGNTRWRQTFFDQMGRALGVFVRPWTSLRAVKANQRDIINALSSQQTDIANALVQLRTLRQDLTRLEASVAEQDESDRRNASRRGDYKS